MKFKRTQDSFRTILKIVIGVVFAVAILAISYKAATTPIKDRSKAAETQVTYKSWEFNGTTTEGWLLTNLSGTRVSGGLLTAKVTGSPTSPVTLVNKSVGSALPQGNKYIKLRLAVAGSTGSPPKSVSQTPINTKFPPPAPVTPFTISVSYTNKGAPRVAPQMRGIADGKLYEYSVLLPDIGSITVDSVKLVISSVKTGTPVQLDYVRLVGSPIPTPTPAPRVPTPTPATCTPNGSACKISVCTPIPTCIPGGPCQTGTCYLQSGVCVNNRCTLTITPSPTPTCYKTCSANGVCTIVCSQPVTPKPTITPTSTSIPTPIARAACNYGCTADSGCQSGLICYSGVCRNPSCTGQTSCSCSITPTPTFPLPYVTSITSQNWKAGDVVTIYGNYLLQPGGVASNYKIYYSTPSTSAAYVVAAILPNQNNTNWEQTAIRFTVPIIPASTGHLVIMWGSSVGNLAVPYSITITQN